MKTRSHNTKILIVDDHDAVSNTLVRILSKEFGKQATIVTCSSAEVALLRLRKSEFELLITDWDLPGMSGDDLTIQARDLSPQIKTILMTGSSGNQVNRKARGCVDVFMTKPFKLPDLLQKAHALLR